LITATISAPAAITSSMFDSLIPPMAQADSETAAFTWRIVPVLAARVSVLDPVSNSRPTDT